MSAFSTVGDVFSDAEFSAAIRSCGDLVRWRSRIVNALGFSSCQSVLTSGVWIHMAATSLTMLRSAWDPETNLLIFLCFFIFALLINLPGPSSVMRSEQAQQRRFERRHNKERRQR